jgi:hypothetical protein
MSFVFSREDAEGHLAHQDLGGPALLARPLQGYKWGKAGMSFVFKHEEAEGYVTH